MTTRSGPQKCGRSTTVRSAYARLLGDLNNVVVASLGLARPSLRESVAGRSRPINRPWTCRHRCWSQRQLNPDEPLALTRIGTTAW